MPEQKGAFQPVSEPNDKAMAVGSSVKVVRTQSVIGIEENEGPLQQLLAESSLDELELQIRKPIQPKVIDLFGIVTRGVTMFSAMSAELGVLLRIQIRGQNVPVTADYENIRRSIDTLIIHLLTLSQSQACVTVVVENGTRNGRGGISVRFSANKIIIPSKLDPGTDDDSDYSQEISACRRLVEKNGGSLSVQPEENEALSINVWIPQKDARGK